MESLIDRLIRYGANGSGTPSVAPIGKRRDLKDRPRRDKDRRPRKAEPKDTVTLGGHA